MSAWLEERPTPSTRYGSRSGAACAAKSSSNSSSRPAGPARPSSMAGTGPGPGLNLAATTSGAPARRHHRDASASGRGTWIAMEEAQRSALRRGRVRLVEGLRPEVLWGPLQARGVFTSAMVEDMQVGCGARPGVPDPIGPAIGRCAPSAP